MSPDQLDAYFARVGLKERPTVDLAGLTILQRAHRLSIPFENLDIPLGRGISLQPEAVFDKLVTHRRGGYCFEQNQLLLRVLHALGFVARPLLARVWLVPSDTPPPRTHTLNLVMLDGETHIVDAGFSASHAPPQRLEADTISTTPDGIRYRLVQDATHGWMSERDGGDGFRPQFSFTLDPVEPMDLEMSNHWTSTWPGSRFTQNIIASIVLPHGSAAIMNRAYTRTNRTERVEADITSARMLQMRLSLVFGIDLSTDEIDALGLF